VTRPSALGSRYEGLSAKLVIGTQTGYVYRAHVRLTSLMEQLQKENAILIGDLEGGQVILDPKSEEPVPVPSPPPGGDQRSPSPDVYDLGLVEEVGPSVRPSVLPSFLKPPSIH